MFPDYDGNGMFKSLGNIAANPHVGLLFIAMGEKPGRLRVNGRAQVVRDDPDLAAIPGAQLLVKVTPTDIFPNCPRYIPKMTLEEPALTSPRRTRPRSNPSGRPSQTSPTWSRHGAASAERSAGPGVFAR